jgi:glycosyltransferase involved in cell wall biosynthesis
VLHGAAGAIVVDEDLASFARAVVEVLTNRELRARLAADARGYVAARWSSSEMARRLLALYERLAGGARAD